MKIRNFHAPDMRTALKQVRLELGADAVMLSSRSVDGGVEVVAASGYDEAEVARMLQVAAAAEAAPVAAATQAAVATPARTTAPAANASQPRMADPAAAFAAAFDRPKATAQTAAGIATTANTMNTTTAADAVAARHEALAERTRARLREADGPTLAELTAAMRPAAPAKQVATRTVADHAANGDDGGEGRGGVARDAFAALLRTALEPADATADTAAAMPANANTSTNANIAAQANPARPAPVLPMAVAPAAIDDGNAANDTAPLESAVVAAVAAATAASVAPVQAATPAIAAIDAPAAATPAVAVAATAPLALVPAHPASAEQRAIESMRGELAQMRALVEAQVRQFDRERLRGTPSRAAAFDLLSAIGCDDALAQAVALRIDPQLDAGAIHVPLLAAFAKALPVLSSEPLEDGGVIALVGPTGAGKTTTAAKLAARFAARHRARDVALLGTDIERPGASEQLQACGRRLGVTVCEARGTAGVQQSLQQLADYPLVLVDTTGHAPNDRALLQQVLWLRGTQQVRSLLVLPATAHPRDLEQVIRRYMPSSPAGVVLTKLDESAAPGAALSVIAASGLSLAYTADGQRIDGDVAAAHGVRIARAVGLDRRADAAGSNNDNPADAIALQDEVRHAAG